MLKISPTHPRFEVLDDPNDLRAQRLLFLRKKTNQACLEADINQTNDAGLMLGIFGVVVGTGALATGIYFDNRTDEIST